MDAYVLSPTNVFRIENCLITKNNVLNTGGINERGGGISSSADSTYIISSIIYSNTVTGENHSEGGGIFIGTAFSAGTVPYASIEGCIVRKNSVSAHCQISSCNGQAFGGGINIECADGYISNTIVDSNYTDAYSFYSGAQNKSYGGGCFVWGSAVLSNSIFSFNSLASNHGGFGGAGLHCSVDTSSIINCTIAYNSHYGFSTIFNSQYDGFGNITNSILWEDYGGTANSEIQNTNQVLVRFSNVQNGFAGIGNLSCNPILHFNLDTLYILPGSCCINAGDTNALYNDVCLPPSLDTATNNIGAHGGPGTCGWSSLANITSPLSVMITTTSGIGQGDGSIVLILNGWFTPGTFSWTGPGTFTSLDQNIDSLYAGWYVVTFSNGNCSFVDSFNVKDPTGLIEIKSSIFFISPNPTQTIFTIHTNSQLRNSEVEMYNMLGEKMYSATLHSEKQTVNCEMFSKGIYFMKVRSGEKLGVQKLVIQ